MDKNCSLTSEPIIAYLTKDESETGIKCIPFEEIRVKSSYVSPMAFCAFGLLKRALEKLYSRTPIGLWKTVEEK
ncbi:hypothetical protein TNCV_1720961 [Trichonephila clavipes]|nr:hypothetical protein TNCV_1720961 [Trichonephila clavipes]